MKVTETVRKQDDGTEREILVLTVAADGRSCAGDLAGGSSLTGMYGEPEKHFPRVVPGGKIVDFRTVPRGIVVREVMRAPMLKLSLDPDGIDRFSDLRAEDSLMAQAMMAEPGNQFGQVLRHEQADAAARPERKLGSLDSVGLDIWLDWWRDRGARIGTVGEGGVEWEPRRMIRCVSCGLELPRFLGERLETYDGVLRCPRPTGDHDGESGEDILCGGPMEHVG